VPKRQSFASTPIKYPNANYYVRPYQSNIFQPRIQTPFLFQQPLIDSNFQGQMQKLAAQQKQFVELKAKQDLERNLQIIKMLDDQVFAELGKGCCENIEMARFWHYLESQKCLEKCKAQEDKGWFQDRFLAVYIRTLKEVIFRVETKNSQTQLKMSLFGREDLVKLKDELRIAKLAYTSAVMRNELDKVDLAIKQLESESFDQQLNQLNLGKAMLLHQQKLVEFQEADGTELRVRLRCHNSMANFEIRKSELQAKKGEVEARYYHLESQINEAKIAYHHAFMFKQAMTRIIPTRDDYGQLQPVSWVDINAHDTWIRAREYLGYLVVKQGNVNREKGELNKNLEEIQAAHEHVLRELEGASVSKTQVVKELSAIVQNLKQIQDEIYNANQQKDQLIAKLKADKIRLQQNFCKSLINNIQSLKKGQHYCHAIGFVEHAMYVDFENLGDIDNSGVETFRMKIFNLGAGAEQHMGCAGSVVIQDFSTPVPPFVLNFKKNDFRLQQQCENITIAITEESVKAQTLIYAFKKGMCESYAMTEELLQPPGTPNCTAKGYLHGVRERIGDPMYRSLLLGLITWSKNIEHIKTKRQLPKMQDLMSKLDLENLAKSEIAFGKNFHSNLKKLISALPLGYHPQTPIALMTASPVFSPNYSSRKAALDSSIFEEQYAATMRAAYDSP